jgi:hypothetical protein
MKVKKSLKHIQSKQCINACILNIMNVIYSSFDELIAMAFNGNSNCSWLNTFVCQMSIQEIIIISTECRRKTIILWSQLSIRSLSPRDFLWWKALLRIWNFCFTSLIVYFCIVSAKQRYINWSITNSMCL